MLSGEGVLMKCFWLSSENMLCFQYSNDSALWLNFKNSGKHHALEVFLLLLPHSMDAMR